MCCLATGDSGAKEYAAPWQHHNKPEPVLAGIGWHVWDGIKHHNSQTQLKRGVTTVVLLETDHARVVRGMRLSMPNDRAQRVLRNVGVMSRCEEHQQQEEIRRMKFKDRDPTGR